VNPLTYRRLKTHEFGRIADIDRTERIRTGYRMKDGRLVRLEVVWDTPPWKAEGEHSVAGMIRALEAAHSHGGVVLGAFEGERLVGVAAFRPHLQPGLGQLSVLHVSNGYRRCGIASQLVGLVEQLARESGASQLYVSATPSGSAIGFYRSRGFAVTATPNPQLLALEPDDIHMIEPL
jgi:ribosomal protein S18 acetylase RimI-like enzyme